MRAHRSRPGHLAMSLLLAGAYVVAGPARPAMAAAPTVTSVVDDNENTTEDVHTGDVVLTITGTNFDDSAVVVLVLPDAEDDDEVVWEIEAEVTDTTATTITATVDTDDQAPGLYDLMVETDGGDALLADAYTLNLATPTITGISPSKVGRNSAAVITITGTNFGGGLTSSLPSPDEIVGTEYESKTRALALATIDPSSTTGSKPVTLRNTDGKTATGQLGVVPGDGLISVTANGVVHRRGDVPNISGFYQGPFNRPLVGITLSNAAGTGAYEVGSDGGVFTAGTAQFHGSAGAIRLNSPVVGMAVTPTGGGYYLVAADGGIFTYGDAVFRGSTGARRLNLPVVGMALTPTGRGYWLIASDGGIFTFGDAGFFGSTGAMRLNQPMVAMAPTPDARGYWLVARDGGVFTFGTAGFFGAGPAAQVPATVYGIVPTQSGLGYSLLFGDDNAPFGDAPYFLPQFSGQNPAMVAGSGFFAAEVEVPPPTTTTLPT